jgi:ubiquinone/menaquinone biosynthesis C-methylase UbiE
MKKAMCGNEMDRMPSWAFKMMAFLFNITDKFKSPDKRLDPFNIRKGQTVVDYGCGTGRYLKSASEKVGDEGTVFAVDIHELAIDSAKRVIKKYDLKNVHPVLTDGKSVDIPSQTADVIYALDMFHMVSDTDGFLKELSRISRRDCVLYLEHGHQPGESSRRKVNDSGCWDIITETKAHMKCKPKNQPR